jgi:hypothetical protein
MRIEKQALALASLFALGVGASAEAAINYSNDFNTAGTFASDFTQNGPNAGNLFQNSAGTGLNGTNAVDLTNNANDATAILTAAGQVGALDSGTDGYTLAGFFRNQNGITGGSAVGIFQLGLGSDTSTAFNGGSTFLSARVRRDGTVEFQTGANGTTVGTGAAVSTSATTLVDGNWYYLTVTLNRTSTQDTFSGTAELYNATSAGVIGSQLTNATSSTLVNAAMYADNSVYAGFRAAGSSGNSLSGANLVDNFSVVAVPEPASLAMLALGALAVRRRSRSAS